MSECRAVITPAHTQTVTLRLVENIPSHCTRETDPYYHIFNENRARMKKLGLLVCWVCGSRDDVEVHHDFVEFCLVEDYEWSKLAADHPEFGITSDEEYRAWVEGPGNLLALCRLHHTGYLGIHNLPYPMWQSLKYLKTGVPVPCRVEDKGEHAP